MSSRLRWLCAPDLVDTGRPPMVAGQQIPSCQPLHLDLKHLLPLTGAGVQRLTMTYGTGL